MRRHHAHSHLLNGIHPGTDRAVRRHRRVRLTVIAALACVLVLLLIAPAPATSAEGVLAQLYAARPPAGSAFVRVVNPNHAPANVKLAGHIAEQLSNQQPASSYIVIPAEFTYAIDFQGNVSSHHAPKAGAFVSLIAQPAGDRLQYITIEDPATSGDGLKAELRFYNLAPGCGPARLTLGPDGPAVFSNTAEMSAQSRAINPVSADVVGWCGKRSVAMTLPTLAAGNYYSIFLTADGNDLRVVGQLNRTQDFTP